MPVQVSRLAIPLRAENQSIDWMTVNNIYYTLYAVRAIEHESSSVCHQVLWNIDDVWRVAASRRCGEGQNCNYLRSTPTECCFLCAGSYKVTYMTLENECTSWKMILIIYNGNNWHQLASSLATFIILRKHYICC